MLPSNAGSSESEEDMALRRGFKKEAEQLALGLRRQLRLRAEAPLPARLLADHLEIDIVGPDEVPGMTTRDLFRLLQVKESNWSAVTLLAKECYLIIHNTTHSRRRQESDLMHEMAHVLCKHKPMRVLPLQSLGVFLREYDEVQEEEAVWLGGCLQLPRRALWWAVKRGMDEMTIADHYGASIDLVRYRRNVTGVHLQLGRLRALG